MWRLGNRGKKIVAVCRKEEEKELIMRNKKKLGSEKIYIDNDLTRGERRIREKVLEKARVLRREGKRVRIGFNKVTTEDEEWIWCRREQTWFRK